MGLGMSSARLSWSVKELLANLTGRLDAEERDLAPGSELVLERRERTDWSASSSARRSGRVASGGITVQVRTLESLILSRF